MLLARKIIEAAIEKASRKRNKFDEAQLGFQQDSGFGNAFVRHTPKARRLPIKAVLHLKRSLRLCAQGQINDAGGGEAAQEAAQNDCSRITGNDSTHRRRKNEQNLRNIDGSYPRLAPEPNPFNVYMNTLIQQLEEA